MRKWYRCPHCGEEVMTRFWPRRFLDNRKRHIYCPECQKPSAAFSMKSKRAIMAFIDIFFALFFFIVFPFYGYYIHINESILVWVVLFGMFYFTLSFAFGIRPLAVMIMKPTHAQYDERLEELVLLNHNATFKLDSLKNIRHRGIYGVKFEKETTNKRFAEAFRDGLVPVVFYMGNARYVDFLTVTIMKTEFVPKEFLTENTPFTVFDNGKAIAKGTVRSINIKTEEK